MIKWLRWFASEYLNAPSVVRSDTARLKCYRVYGFRPYYRLPLFDYTEVSAYVGKPSWVRIQVLRKTVYERNREWSGLPGARVGATANGR